jgi:hypothetical protein
LVSTDDLKDLLSHSQFTDFDKLLVCLAIDVGRPKSVLEIRELAFGNGLRAAKKWDISKLLSRSKGKARRVEKGWELSTSGKEYVNGLIGPFINLPVVKTMTSLRSHLDKIANPDTKAFIDEAIKCCEFRLWRAAVVLSWVGAVSVMYDFVVKHKLVEFNTAAARRKLGWKPAKTRDHFERMKESEFLQVIRDISMIDKNQKQELDHRLELRNGCGHPTALKIAEHQVASHIEFLILNVFSKFPLESETPKQEDGVMTMLEAMGFVTPKK